MTPDSIAIRDAAEALLSGLAIDGIPAFKFTGRVPVDQEPDDDLPSLLVIATREQMQPDGDLNAGEPSFIVDLSLTILMTVSASQTIGDSDQKAARIRADEKLSARIWPAQSALLRTPSFLALFDGVGGISTTRIFDKDGERFFARTHIELTLQYRTTFPPIVEHDLEKVEITATFPEVVPGQPVRAKVVLPT